MSPNIFVYDDEDGCCYASTDFQDAISYGRTRRLDVLTVICGNRCVGFWHFRSDGSINFTPHE